MRVTFRFFCVCLHVYRCLKKSYNNVSSTARQKHYKETFSLRSKVENRHLGSYYLYHYLIWFLHSILIDRLVFMVNSNKMTPFGTSQTTVLSRLCDPPFKTLTWCKYSKRQCWNRIATITWEISFGWHLSPRTSSLFWDNQPLGSGI